jgi:hypothetical protein
VIAWKARVFTSQGWTIKILLAGQAGDLGAAHQTVRLDLNSLA